MKEIKCENCDGVGLKISYGYIKCEHCSIKYSTSKVEDINLDKDYKRTIYGNMLSIIVHNTIIVGNMNNIQGNYNIIIGNMNNVVGVGNITRGNMNDCKNK